MPTDPAFEDRVLWARLSSREARFVAEYLRTTNAVLAYRNAFQPDSDQGLHATEAERIRKSTNVRNILAAIYQRIAKPMEVDAQAVIIETAKIAFSDARAYLDTLGNLLPIGEISDNAAGALAGIEITTVRDGDGEAFADVKKIRQWDKVAALKLLSQLLGMHVKRTEDVTKGGEFRIVRRLPDADNPLYQ